MQVIIPGDTTMDDAAKTRVDADYRPEYMLVDLDRFDYIWTRIL
jgi:hypothetical protein